MGVKKKRKREGKQENQIRKWTFVIKENQVKAMIKLPYRIRSLAEI